MEISRPAEVHVKYRQLVISQEDETYNIPLEDLECITCIGPGIRISTMALSIISDNQINMLIMDKMYRPSAVVSQFSGNSRQSLIMNRQINLDEELKKMVWNRIIKKKLMNQNEALKLMGYTDRDILKAEIESCCVGNEEPCESAGARKYFNVYDGWIKRRIESPVNSRLNYGYAVVRNAIIRSLIVAGFHPAIGIHHSSQLNAFNFADDLIEPLRPMVDLVAESVTEHETVELSRKVRRIMANVLFCRVKIDDSKTIVLYSINKMVESLKTVIIKEDISELLLPDISPLSFEERIKV